MDISCYQEFKEKNMIRLESRVIYDWPIVYSLLSIDIMIRDLY